MSNVLETPASNPQPVPQTEPVANRFTPSAQERMARLRAIAAEFANENNARPLTVPEIRIARQTSLAALETAAVFAEAAPGIGNAIVDVNEMRETIAFEIAYAGVRDEARALARLVDLAILRRKLQASKIVRGLYRVGKGYITLDVGDPVRTHVADMKRTLVKARRKKPVPPATDVVEPATVARQ